MITLNGKYTDAYIMIDEVEPECIAQIIRMINHPAFTNPVRIMPDTHTGKGSVIGFTMRCNGKVVPNVIGVDIGCGVDAIYENLSKSSLNLESIDKQIRERIPFGREINTHARVRFEDNFGSIPYLLDRINFNWKTLYGFSANDYGNIKEYLMNMCERIGLSYDYFARSLGTLGGGNHYIELGVDTKNHKGLFIQVHSGSRHLGKKVCDYWQKRAVLNTIIDREGAFSDVIDRVKKSFPKNLWDKEIKKAKAERNKVIVNSNGLEYLEGMDALGYLKDMIVAQEYATINRNFIINTCADIVLKAGTIWSGYYTSVHNYIEGNLMIRKGAIEAYKGQEILIPLNMKEGTLLCRGLGNVDWNLSAPHGAGRIMSRSKAKATLDLEEYKKTMEGIYSTSVNLDTIDEAPMAYKNAEVIMEAIKPTAEIITRIIPILNLKASGD